MAFMSEQDANQIAALRKAKRVTQHELAERLGVHVVTISKLERGKMQLTTKWIHLIADALGVHPGDVFAPPQRVDVVFLAGSIKRGNLANFNTKNMQRYAYEIDDPEDQASAWIGVADESLAPFFHWGDVLRFTSYYEDIHLVSEGRLVFVQTDDGRDIMGTVEKVHEHYLFDIRTITGTLHREVKTKFFWLFSGAIIRALDDTATEMMEKLAE